MEGEVNAIGVCFLLNSIRGYLITNLIEEEMLVSVFDDIAVALYVEVQIESVVLVSYSDLSLFEYDFR